ncbi:hypothetical protein T265_03461 [Opisthorchis viverrini]|uniref:Uncharacterized protein n=1 Tax=Opisthorchis viverrini TaxID=6198 RepID=A0A074ZS51_OPIVI|nr:hypothetical protein T265_03461 [Opisthorchis viverrini]KER29971.1 hypothetical protein T265_03461 [Opisthorchis viverrini]
MAWPKCSNDRGRIMADFAIRPSIDALLPDKRLLIKRFRQAGSNTVETGQQLCIGDFRTFSLYRLRSDFPVLTYTHTHTPICRPLKTAVSKREKVEVIAIMTVRKQ